MKKGKLFENWYYGGDAFTLRNERAVIMWESEVGRNLAIVEVPGELLEEISAI